MQRKREPKLVAIPVPLMIVDQALLAAKRSVQWERKSAGALL
jgi:hypothetical protein